MNTRLCTEAGVFAIWALGQRLGAYHESDNRLPMKDDPTNGVASGMPFGGAIE